MDSPLFLCSRDNSIPINKPLAPFQRAFLETAFQHHWTNYISKDDQTLILGVAVFLFFSAIKLFTLSVTSCKILSLIFYENNYFGNKLFFVIIK